jgi:D-methionine transport system ATP-binding protein
MLAGDALIRLEKVSKDFFIGGEKTRVIDGIDLHVDKKEIFGLVGETGSGKSTILRMMNGFIEPEEGSIFLMDKFLNRASRRELVKETSMIFQGFNLLGNLNVIENILLPTRLRKGNQRENIEKARELLSFVGLSDFEEAHIRNLSGGQKQRVAIARTLITNPRIIFCDEPTSALDEKMSYEILRLLKDINEKFETTIVMVSHDIGVIKSVCSRVAVMEDGRISELISLTPKGIAPVSYKEAFLSD